VAAVARFTGPWIMKINLKALLLHSDRTSGAVLLILGGFCIAEAWRLPFGTVSAPDAGFFPLTLSVMLFSIGAMICAMSFVRASEPVEFGGQAWAVVVTAGAFVLYAVCLQPIGYVACTLLILLLLMRGLGGLDWMRSLLIAISGVVLSYLAFVQLGVPLPRGIMPF
jgi:predicted membrane channel-forming protein YqfA (hemolysin III family)